MNPKIKLVCPKCGGDSIACDGDCRWDVNAQEWRLAGAYSETSIGCADCGYDGDNIKRVEVDVTPETSDLGHLIAAKLGAHDPEGAVVPIYGKSTDGDSLSGQQIDQTKVEDVDLSDPDNLVVTLETGHQFTVRIFAGA